MSAPEPLNPTLVQAQAAAHEHRRLHDIVSRTLAPVRLSTAACLALEAVARRTPSGASVAEVAAFSDIHRTSVTATIGRLLTMGLVSSAIDETDARRSTIRLTASGERALTSARRLLSQGHDAARS